MILSNPNKNARKFFEVKAEVNLKVTAKVEVEISLMKSFDYAQRGKLEDYAES